MTIYALGICMTPLSVCDHRVVAAAADLGWGRALDLVLREIDNDQCVCDCVALESRGALNSRPGREGN